MQGQKPLLSSSMISEVFLLVEQIRPRTAQVDDLGTPVSILLQTRTFEAVECIRDALATAHDTLVLVVPKGALIADSHQGRRSHIRVADGAFAVAFVAESADGDACGLAAHDEIAGEMSAQTAGQS